jgi:tRNA A-37 threonylcarbamoyl transferase component Bud32
MNVDLQLPSFAEAAEWLNRQSTELETKGHPTLVHFWSVSSEISKTNLAQIADLRDQRKREGVRVIAVHVPLSEAEKDRRAVRKAIERLNITEPCVLDNDHKLSEALLDGLDGVPSYYLFDLEGGLRSSSTSLETIEDELDQVLADLRSDHPFCAACELFLNKEAMFCAECGLPLTLPRAKGAHPYYDSNYNSSLPTIRLANPDRLIGHVIDGKYQLSAKLGEGGMSVVYRARRIHIGDDVAVKILTKKFVNDDAALTRFRREARAAALLRHPNIITIHDFGEANDEHSPAYIVMEFVRGTPLSGLLKSENHFSVGRGERLMRGICAGVAAAHRQSVVHRDLKPENILVVAPEDDFELESVRVVDFGLAKLMTDPDTPSTDWVVGTPYYMSPEQCLGEPLDARSDVYSLGVMFYEMLSGKRPFADTTVSGVINRHLSDPPPPLSPALAIPRRISTGIMQALAKDPNSRPQTATELARQMQLV